MRRPKDRDFVETEDGLIWCLVGYLHPPDRYTAYLKYAPAGSGRWKRAGIHFRRQLEYYHVRNIAKTLEFLKIHYPCYVGFDHFQNLTFSFVPRGAVTFYYRPEERLQEILVAPADRLEKDVEILVSLLVAAGGPEASVLGITGSILLSIHDPSFSDIDLIVYGRDATARIRAAVSKLRRGPIEEVPQDRMNRWRSETAARFFLGPDDVARLEARRWNYFQFQDRYVSVHPTRRDDEIDETYGQHTYRALGVATIEAQVMDAEDSIFLPAHYALADVVVREGRFLRSFDPSTKLRAGSAQDRLGLGQAPQITELISYEGLYCQAVDPGNRIVARGVLEQIDDGPCRLVVGAAGLPDGGFMRLLA
jgi:predicted nucleotidyltransferase